MTLIDVIILSYNKNDYLKSLTEQTISSLIESEDPKAIKFNIIVIESNKSLEPFQYSDTTTIYPKADFGFNKFLNIGIDASANPYICLCNNDLIFHKGWASEILKLMSIYPKLKSVNPLCPDFEPTKGKYNDERLIFANRKNIFQGILTGWCIFTKRDLFEKIGTLDEQFEFWYADRDYGMTLLKHKIQHALALDSMVTHLGNKSHDSLDEKYDDLTSRQKLKYEAKWGKEESILLRLFKSILQRCAS